MNALNRKPISAYAGPVPAQPLPPNATMADVCNNLQTTFANFQAANDDALKGKANMETVENINRDLTAIKKTLDDLRANTARGVLGGGGASPNIGAHAFARVIGGDRGASVSEADYTNYRQAFDVAARRGFFEAGLPPDVRAAMQTGFDPSGGYWVPVEISTEIEQRLRISSPMRRLGRVMSIGSGAWEGPWKDGTAKSGGWVGERSSRPATPTGSGGMQRIPVHEIYAYPEVTQTLLDDASVDVAGMLQDEIDESFGQDESNAFVFGNGVVKPRGFLDHNWVAKSDKDRPWNSLEYKATGAAGGFKKLSGGGDDVDVFVNTLFALKGGYRNNSTWVMNSATHAKVRTLKDNEGRYLVGLTQMESGLEFAVHGYPVTDLEDMPDIEAGKIPIVVGDWKRGYLIVDRRGIRIIRDELTNKPMVGFYMTKRVGGDVRNFEALKGIKVAA